MEDIRNVYKIFTGRPERKRLLRRSRCKWDDIIMDLREIWGEDVDWIHLVQDRDQ
jgi:hypothetical protein